MKTIMIIDDEEISNFIVKKYLALFAKGTEVLEFTDARDAYYSLAFNKPDLIFLDLHMPEFSGWEFLEKMEDEGLSQKVVVLTASPNSDDQERAHAFHNVVNYYVKPLSDEDIKEIVESH